MATLNTSAEGPSINRSYQSIVNAPQPSGPAASSPTYGQWAVFTVSAPLVSAFQQDTGKESTLKVQCTGEGELDDLFEEFSDGRIQFAFVRVKDPNTSLPKFVLLAWCGAGVPERSKGNFTSHLAAVSKLLHGYHVQVTARSEADLSPEGIIRKVSDASGSRYSGDAAPVSSSNGPPPPIASKPVFTPTQVGGASGGFNQLGSRSRTQTTPSGPVDNDGWGEDAPPVTRRQLEKVAPAYKPTKVDMGQLSSQQQEPSRFSRQDDERSSQEDVVRGGYQPVGKVDIAAIRRQAQQGDSSKDDRPTAVKGSYEPVGKVDIAAIRARAQPSSSTTSQPTAVVSPAGTGDLAGQDDSTSEPKSLVDRSAAFTQSERMTSMPKPKVANRFGSGAGSFAGTKAPAPGGFEAKPLAAAAPVGTASKTFADAGGKTPAQQWAERKARERGTSGAADTSRSGQAPIASQTSGGQWESGYSGKKWGAVQTTRTGQSGVSQDRTGEQPEEDDPSEQSGNVSAIRDRFKNAAPMGGAVRDEDENDAPPPPMASRPAAGGVRGVPMPGFAQKTPAEEQIPDEEHSRMPTPPAQPPRSPTPPDSPAEPSSPIRVAQPVSRSKVPDMEPPEERFSPPPVPAESLARAVPPPQELDEEPQVTDHDPARGAAQAAAVSGLGLAASKSQGGHRARVEFDYEKAEDNELELTEGDIITNIDMVDEDWWMGENSKGEKGLFPANYTTPLEDEDPTGPAESAREPSPPAAPAAARPPPAATPASKEPTATSEFDYEAAEENEISFPENAKITNISFPDEDWWLGEYNGKEGLFPANYVVLDK